MVVTGSKEEAGTELSAEALVTMTGIIVEELAAIVVLLIKVTGGITIVVSGRDVTGIEEFPGITAGAEDSGIPVVIGLDSTALVEITVEFPIGMETMPEDMIGGTGSLVVSEAEAVVMPDPEPLA